MTSFVGLTTRASRFEPLDLLFTPVTVRSLEDYETFFGSWAHLAYPTLRQDPRAGLQIVASSNPRGLYGAVRLFFGNGGQEAVILSVGVTRSDPIPPAMEDLHRGLELLFGQTQGGIVCVPDAGCLSFRQQTELYEFLLRRCVESQEHLAFLEVAVDDPAGAQLPQLLPAFGREFAVCIAPAMLLTDGPPVDYCQLPPPLQKGAADVPFAEQAPDVAAAEALARFQALNGDQCRIRDTIARRMGNPDSWIADIERTLRHCHVMPEARATAIPRLISELHQFAWMFNDWVQPPAFQSTRLERIVEEALDQTLRFAFAGLISTEQLYARALVRRGISYRCVWSLSTLPNSPWWGDSLSAAFADGSTEESPLEVAPRLDEAILDQVSQVFAACLVVLEAVKTRLGLDQEAAHEVLLHVFPLYREASRLIVDWNSRSTATGAVVGMLAKREREQGSWGPHPLARLAGMRADQGLSTLPKSPRLDTALAWNCSVTVLESPEGSAVYLPTVKTLASLNSPFHDAAMRLKANWIHQRIRLETLWVLFEPRGPALILKLRNQLTELLTTLWRQGVLAGTSAAEAFELCAPTNRLEATSETQGTHFEIEARVALRGPGDFHAIRVAHRVS